MLINKLDKKVFNRISAGEVVERPASIVKELVENSIDSGATFITINVKKGGKELIEVIDNGSGIYEEDIPLSILPHATSKISTAEDLDNILTLGFRGEALASIASISKLTISSKRKECDIGYKYSVNGGEEVSFDKYPMNDGTIIQVKDIFYNTPARLKFLKTDKYEENEISDLIARLILANPNVSFLYKADNEKIFQSHGNGLDDSIISVYGVDTLKNCFKVDQTKNGVHIFGYIGNQNFVKGNKTYESSFVNGRYINNNTISSAIYNAYSQYLMKRKYPFYVINIVLPRSVVDVNVTPNKSDVRFVDNSIIYGTLYSIVSKTLNGSDSAPVVERKIEGSEISELFNENITFRDIENSLENKETLPHKDIDVIKISADNIEKNAEIFNQDNIQKNIKYEDVLKEISKEKEEEKKEEKVDIFAENKKYLEELDKQNKEFTLFKDEPSLEFKCQILNTYLILEKGNEVFFIDQHAAHERLLYNRFIEIRKGAKTMLQPLLVPFTFKVNPIEYSYIKNKIEYMNDIGIGINENSRGEFEITELPLELMEINLKDFIDDILSDNAFKIESIPEVVNERLMQKACKAAIKGGDKLDKSEIDSLLKLLNGNLDLKCPHGRPIACKIEKKEIEKWFKRIV